MSDYRRYTGEEDYRNSVTYEDLEEIRRKAARERRRKKRKRALIAKCTATALAGALGSGAVVYAACAVSDQKNKEAVSTEEMTNAETAADGSVTEETVSADSTGLTADFDGTADGTVADVAARAMSSLVTISCTSVEEMTSMFGQRQQYESSSAGSGVIIGSGDTELYIATNNHVIDGATIVSIGFVDETAVAGTVKGADAENDLAVVAVQLSDIPEDTMNQISIATVGDSDALVLGDQVVAIGNALGIGQSVTSGYVSAFDRDLTLQGTDGSTITSTGLIQTDASINSGNSGGGLFNMKGELIAINEAKSSTTSSGVTVDNMGFAIPMAKAVPILQSLIDGSASTQDQSQDVQSTDGYEDYSQDGSQGYENYGGDAGQGSDGYSYGEGNIDIDDLFGMFGYGNVG